METAVQTRLKDKGLYDLVHSLTKTEKRYFQLAIAGEEKGNAVTREVFSAFLEMRSPMEEAQFMAQCTAPYGKHFSATKYHVKERLLRAMRAYHEQADVDARLRAMLDDIAFLHRKGLWDLLRKRLRKALHLAGQFERFRIQLELLQWERQLVFQHPPRDLQSALQELDSRCEALFQYIRTDNLAETLHSGILAMSKKNTRLRKAGEIQALHTLLAPLSELEADTGNSFFARVSVMNVKGLRDFLLGEYATAYRHFEQALATWAAQPKMLNLYLGHYRISLTNFSNCCFFLDRLDDLHAAMASMSELPNLPPLEQLQFETTRYHLDLMHLLNMARFDEAGPFLQDLASWLNTHHKSIQSARLKLLRYNAALLKFMGGAPAATLKWLGPILANASDTLREDIHDFAHCLELMAHLELENWGLVHSRTRSLLRRGRGKNWRNGFLGELLVFFREMEKAGGELERKMLEDALERLREIMTWPGRLPFGMQETVFWMESKLKGLSLRDFMEEMVAARS